MGFFEQFESEWAPRLGRRRGTFLKAFQYLAARRKAGYCIVETGCARGTGGWDGDGNSTLLFDRFVAGYGGSVHSVDLSEEACAYARSQVGSRTTVTRSDSVKFLHGMAGELRRAGREIDLLYLDSFDVDPKDPRPSAAHHLKELCAIAPALTPGTLVMIDDAVSLVMVWRGDDAKLNLVHDLGLSGKAEYVAEYFQAIGVRPLFTGYQYGWVIPE